jgi:hypothetical protein
LAKETAARAPVNSLPLRAGKQNQAHAAVAAFGNRQKKCGADILLEEVSLNLAARPPNQNGR